MKKKTETHQLKFLRSRPSIVEIYQMVQNHFDLEVKDYDKHDSKNEKRRKYTNSVNEIISRRIHRASKVLSIACGTGRRDLDIRKLSGGDYKIHGVEISSKMSEISNSNGIECISANWPEVELKKNYQYDHIFFLYAFGAIPDDKQRFKALKKIKSFLNKDGSLFIYVFEH